MRYNPTPYHPREGERFALEVQIAPARDAVYRGRGERRVQVRPARPARFRGFGAMPTSPSNEAPDRSGIPDAPIVDCGAAGDFVPRMKRRRLPDGSRARYVPEDCEDLPARARRSTLEAEECALALVHQALVEGCFVHHGRIVRLVPTPTGAVRTIPDKGTILKWASVDDLVQAIATGAF